MSIAHENITKVLGYKIQDGKYNLSRPEISDEGCMSTDNIF